MHIVDVRLTCLINITYFTYLLTSVYNRVMTIYTSRNEMSTTICMFYSFGIVFHTKGQNLDSIYTVFHKIGTPLYFCNNYFKC